MSFARSEALTEVMTGRVDFVHRHLYGMPVIRTAGFSLAVTSKALRRDAQVTTTLELRLRSDYPFWNGFWRRR